MMWGRLATCAAVDNRRNAAANGGAGRHPTLLLFLLACSSAWSQTYTIAGVVNTDGGRPAKRVRVAVANIDARENQTAMQTGEDGRFRFDGLPRGQISTHR